MEAEKSQYSKLWVCGIITVGAISPLILLLVTGVLFSSTSIFEVIKFSLSFLLLPIGLLGLLLNAAPFVVHALQLKKLQIGRLNKDDSNIYFKSVAEMIGAGFAGFIVNISIQFIVLSAAYRGEPGSAIAGSLYFFLPIHTFIAMGIGYLLGGLVGKLILWNRSRKLS